MEFNREYDADTESAIGISPIKEIPKFEPRISVAEMEQLMDMDEKLQPIAIATHKALSMAEQRGSWRDEVMVNLVARVREMRREQIRAGRSKNSWIGEIVKIAISSLLAALALWWLKLL